MWETVALEVQQFKPIKNGNISHAAKLKESDGLTNINKKRIPVHKILQNIISAQNFDLLCH